MSNVLITYCWVRSSYAAMRNLASHGINVYVSDSSAVGMCQWSKLKKGFDKYVSHYDSENHFVQDILQICGNRKIDLIIPSHNETEILSRHLDKLGPKIGAALPDFRHCELFNNKARAYELVKSLGISVPKRFGYFNPDDLIKVLKEEGVNNTVIKILTGNSSKGVFYAETPKETVTIVRKLIDQYSLTPDRYPQVEERVIGEGWGCSVLFWNGNRIADFTHRRLREKIETGGTSTLRESAELAPLRLDALKIFKSLGWHGLAMCEFKVCPTTGKYWFIEVNPRMWGSIPLAISAGVEFPYLLWLCATSGPQVAIEYQSKSITRYPWRGKWLLGDMFSVTKKLIRFRVAEAGNIVFKEHHDSLDDFYLDDPGAFVGEVAYYLSSSVSSLSFNPISKGMVR